MLLDPNDERPVHFVGIAGAGMSALAELFVRRGVKVTGCDANAVDVDDLRKLGIQIAESHNPDHVGGTRALVITSAMPRNHPELERARSKGIPVIRRAEALGEATSGDGRDLVGIAGTHGKSTTTVMTTEALAAADMNPTALVGARVSQWNGNFRAGGDDFYVVEADEYDRSFLTLSPTVAVVTNIEADHLDIYADLADIRGAFQEYAQRARIVVLCADDPGSNSLPVPSSSEVIRYGVKSADARLKALNVRHESQGVAFGVEFDGEFLGSVALRVAGTHNVLNALAAVASGLALGAPFAGLAYGLGNFAGAARRFEKLGEARGIDVIDDYAHHPTEISATVQAARAAYPGRRLVLAFQPHLYSRTRDFAREFACSLAAADDVYLTEIYAAREKPIDGVTADLIVNALGPEKSRLRWRGERGALADVLMSELKHGDVLITMGAGDITRVGREVMARLRATK